MYGHRAAHLDSHSGQRGVAYPDSLLVEGNRIGHAASNPGNNGAESIALSAGRVIFRENALFGSAGPGLYFKNGIVSSYNRVYSNTIVNNGRFVGTQHAVSPIVTANVYYTSTTTYNTLLNNLLYGNVDDYCCGTIPATWTVSTNRLHADGDPLFVNLDVSTPSSATLPDLTLTAASDAIDAGTSLTLANGADTNSLTLVVDDSLFFQDGSWGSSLSDIKADWVAVGTVGNVAQIASIDYTTHTITLATTLTWADDAPVWLYKDSTGRVVLVGHGPRSGRL